MKTLNRTAMVAIPLIGLALLTQGCASTRLAAKAPACPECKVVTIQHKSASGEPIYYWTGDEVQHSCPGCQGAWKTFLDEGRLRHACSLCRQNSTTCPTNHRQGTTKLSPQTPSAAS